MASEPNTVGIVDAILEVGRQRASLLEVATGIWAAGMDLAG
jgi:hypothetical protein